MVHATRCRRQSEDKEATKQLLEQMKQSLQDKIVVDVIDEYTDAYNAYTEASQLKVDARRVVTVTVMLICMVS